MNPNRICRCMVFFPLLYTAVNFECTKNECVHIKTNSNKNMFQLHFKTVEKKNIIKNPIILNNFNSNQSIWNYSYFNQNPFEETH